MNLFQAIQNALSNVFGRKAAPKAPARPEPSVARPVEPPPRVPGGQVVRPSRAKQYATGGINYILGPAGPAAPQYSSIMNQAPKGHMPKHRLMPMYGQDQGGNPVRLGIPKNLPAQGDTHVPAGWNVPGVHNPLPPGGFRREATPSKKKNPAFLAARNSINRVFG